MSGKLRVLIPAAGSSKRFRDVGINTPKGMIRFRLRGSGNRPMLAHIVEGHRLDPYRINVGVSSEEREWQKAVTPLLVNRVGRTRGQAETVLNMLRTIPLEDDGPVLVLNSDCAYLYPLDVFVAQAKGYKKAVLVFPSDDRAYSYVDALPLFHTAREKEPFSPWAIAGAYYFEHRSQLLEAITSQIAANHLHAGEFYLSGTLTYMSGTGLAVAMQRDQWINWGTPEDLARDPRVVVEDPAIESILKELR